jgi:hypothetical protein
MTLDFTKTADDNTLIQTLRPLLADRIWHDGARWWARVRHHAWVPTTMTKGHWQHLAYAGSQLPDTPYWARSKHRLSTFATMYTIAAQLRWDCNLNDWPRPEDLAP